MTTIFSTFEVAMSIMVAFMVLYAVVSFQVRWSLAKARDSIETRTWRMDYDLRCIMTEQDKKLRDSEQRISELERKLESATTGGHKA